MKRSLESGMMLNHVSFSMDGFLKLTVPQKQIQLWWSYLKSHKLATISNNPKSIYLTQIQTRGFFFTGFSEGFVSSKFVAGMVEPFFKGTISDFADFAMSSVFFEMFISDSPIGGQRWMMEAYRRDRSLNLGCVTQLFVELHILCHI